MSTIHLYSDTERSNWAFKAEQGALTENKSKSSQVPQLNLPKANRGTRLIWDVLTVNAPCFNCTAMSISAENVL